ncbi:MAG: hypothetical protein IPH51_17940 [Rubrivivax sp.]|nr:hypothetical protein [Rubrivivax sp.]
MNSPGSLSSADTPASTSTNTIAAAQPAEPQAAVLRQGRERRQDGPDTVDPDPGRQAGQRPVDLG